ncbi:MAG: LOG family protein [Opitutales bacterium]
MYPPHERSTEEWPIKAYKNLDFLNSEEARNIRILCEMTEPGLRLRKEGVENTIVLFGSARIRPAAEAKAYMDEVRAGLADPENPSPAEKRALNKAECGIRTAPYYDAAKTLSAELTRWSLQLPEGDPKRFLICSGGGPGIMEAANQGAREVNGKSIGLGISLPFEQGVNDHVPDDLQFEFHYFFVRKYWFVLPAKALVAFPGGFGTLDEVFETLTLVQTKKIDDPPPVVLFGSDFWNDVLNFDALVEWGTISPEDKQLFHIVDTVEEAKKCIVDSLTARFGGGR